MVLLVLLVIFFSGNCVLFTTSASSVIRENDLKTNLFLNISNLKSWKCDENVSYPVLVSNVNIFMTNESQIEMSGTLQSLVDLNQHIQAEVVLKRYVWKFWAHVPCEHNLGSCTYSDLCAFGVPSDKSCPKNFVEQNVPCRCPISKGTYTLRMKVNYHYLLNAVESIYSGSYKGSITVKHDDNLLSCYMFSFDIVDKEKGVLPSVILIK